MEYEIEDRSSSGSDDSEILDDDREDEERIQYQIGLRCSIKGGIRKTICFHGHTPMDPDSIFTRFQLVVWRKYLGKRKEGLTGIC